ncbi:MAG: hypothetical protein AAF585_08360 [Verrucomicrobiota bacterium]
MKRILSSIFAIAFLASAAAQDENAQQQLFLTDGRSFEGRLTGVRDDRLMWQEIGAPGSISIMLDEVDHVSFPPPPVWNQIMELFDKGEYERALAGLEPISNTRTDATFYPAPGNFATLAERRLLDCYRKLRRWGDLRYVQRKIEWNKLPVEERELASVFAVWAEIGDEEWDEALKFADIAMTEAPASGPELGFARALAYKGLGNEKDAIIALAETFGPYSGSDRELAKEAMIECANLVGNDPDRQPELKALVHTYSAIYGNGKIWDGSTPLQNELLALKLDTIGGPKTRRSAGEGEEMVEAEGTMVARYIRIVQPSAKDTGIKIGEVEVMQGGYNIAKQGKPSVSDPDKENPASNAIDGKTKVKAHAAAKPGDNQWFELDMGKVEVMDALVVWPHFIGADANDLKASKSLKDFHIVLLDGDRKQVYAERNIKEVGPKYSIDLIEAAKNMEQEPPAAPKGGAKGKGDPKGKGKAAAKDKGKAKE